MLVKFNLEKREFKVCPEGERILEITKAEATPSGKPNKLTVTFKDIETDATVISRYDFNNDKGLFAMGMLCKVALGMQDQDEFDTAKDTKNLIGKKIVCEVVHTQGTQEREDGTYPTFANIKKTIKLADEENIGARNIIANNTESVGDDL